MRVTILAVATALFAVGCNKGPVLEPAAGATVGPRGAMATVEDVTVTVQPEQWRGIALIEDELIPMQVTVDNDSDRELRIRYEQFALVAPNGQLYRPVPPDRVEMLDLDAELKAQLLDDGLPEAGVGEQALTSGYLYFERVPDTMRRVTFRFELVDDETGREFGQIEIPFRLYSEDEADDRGLTFAE